jgi:hypothetical protein
VDRYTKIVLTVIALALVALALRPLLPQAASAQIPGVDWSQKTVEIPREWGRFVGVGSPTSRPVTARSGD